MAYTYGSSRLKPTLESLTGKNYLSYSALSSYLDCGNRFYLERIANAPQSPAWYFVGGDAVHLATEWLDTGEHTDPDVAWKLAWEQALKRVEPGMEVRSSGRKTKDWPDKENDAWWLHFGPQFVTSWVKWRDEKRNEGWALLELPGGEPAIEVPVNYDFDDVLVKGYIDRVMVDPNGQVVVVDLKSGSREPASSLQLAVYALGLQKTLGIGASLGGYWMARQGDIPSLHSLTHLTEDLLGRWFSDTKKAIENQIFIPKVGQLCSTCSVAPYCAAVGGNPEALAHSR